ncbi:MAG: hypothetical protein QF733_07415 [Phycisphaerales bacterium]|jgi:hypothetical protein|nr:hypothetical protein [Phycisphaerales bacterium]
MRTRLIATAATALLAGCVSPPSVQVLDTGRITEQTADATAGTVQVHITNPNDRAIKLVEYNYTVRAPGRGAWNGRHAAGLVLSPGFDRVADLPVVLPAGTGAGATLSIGGTLRYLDTSVFAETMAEWGYRPTASFSGSATVQAE